MTMIPLAGMTLGIFTYATVQLSFTSHEGQSANFMVSRPAT